jgi:hypothetical protein
LISFYQRHAEVDQEYQHTSDDGYVKIEFA